MIWSWFAGVICADVAYDSIVRKLNVISWTAGCCRIQSSEFLPSHYYLLRFQHKCSTAAVVIKQQTLLKFRTLHSSLNVYLKARLSLSPNVTEPLATSKYILVVAAVSGGDASCTASIVQRILSCPKRQMK